MITDKMLMTKDGAIGRMVFNNPARHNAVSLEMWEGAEAIIDDFARDPAIRVIAVSGAGGKELFFTARQFTAQQARVMGLVNQVVPEAELEAFVDNYAKTIAENAPLTVTQVKRTVGELVKDAADRDIALTERLVAECFASEDYIEGRRAFMEKRKAQFRGR